MTNHSSYSYPETKADFLQAPEQNRVKRSKLFSLFNKIWQYILIAQAEAQQPKIWQRRDRLGQIWWYGYDPVTDRSICRDSEDEIRIWLEERYYQ